MKTCVEYVFYPAQPCWTKSRVDKHQLQAFYMNSQFLVGLKTSSMSWFVHPQVQHFPIIINWLTLDICCLRATFQDISNRNRFASHEFWMCPLSTPGDRLQRRQRLQLAHQLLLEMACSWVIFISHRNKQFSEPLSDCEVPCENDGYQWLSWGWTIRELLHDIYDIGFAKWSYQNLQMSLH